MQYGSGVQPVVTKLAVVVVQDDDAQNLIDAVVARGYRVTRMNTVGGFLRTGNATLLIGIDERHADGLLYLIRQHCRNRMVHVLATPLMDTGEPFLVEPLEVEVGGAVIFFIDVERFVSF